MIKPFDTEITSQVEGSTTEYIIYILIDPITKCIFYVGRTHKTLTQRLRGHTYKCVKAKLKREGWGAMGGKDHYIISNRINPEIQELERIRGFNYDANERERFWIHFLASNGFPLMNHNGLSGVTEPRSIAA